MQSAEYELEGLLERVQERERVSRRRILIFSATPVILALLFLWSTIWQIRRAQAKLEALQTTFDQQQIDLTKAKKEFTDTKQELDHAKQDVEHSKVKVQEASEKLKAAESELERLKKEAEVSRKRVNELQKQVEELNNQVESDVDRLETIGREMGRQSILAMHLTKFIFTGDETKILQNLSNSYPAQSELFSDILDMQRREIRWHAGGDSPERGFDSYAFVAYILEKQHLLSIRASEAHSRLRKLMPQRDKPQVGDVVFYRSGEDAMFYFLDEQNKPFVIGMTHLGILILRPEFAQIEGYGAVQYLKGN